MDRVMVWAVERSPVTVMAVGRKKAEKMRSSLRSAQFASSSQT